MKKQTYDHGGSVSVGLDIGTTTISAAILDNSSGRVRKTYTVPNASSLPGRNAWEHMQSPEWIWKKTTELLDSIQNEYAVSSIGVTGQMHGILCTGADGTALSPLYTWQDRRAGQGKNSTCERIRIETGFTVPEGYGLATLAHLLRQKALPVGVCGCCTIMDYVTMRLCGLVRPVLHITNAASWGFYRHDWQHFDADALRKLGIHEGILPEVTAKASVLGFWRGIPVAVAIGDNQAAFIGSVKDPANTVLVNVGTGSQISMLADEPLKTETPLVESRPFDGEKILLSGACLCGGRAYAMLESFFRRYAEAAGLPDRPGYELLNRIAAKGYEKGSVLSVRTTFCGTRTDSSVRGEITGIGEDNLTPEALAAGVLYGIADELYSMYKIMPAGDIRVLAASGNAVRKNPILQRILADRFGLPLQIPDYTEEAACGAALFGRGVV